MKRLLLIPLLFLLNSVLYAGTFEEKFISYNQRKVTYYEEKLATLEHVDTILALARAEVANYINKVTADYTVSIDTINTFIVRVDKDVYVVTVIYTLILE